MTEKGLDNHSKAWFIIATEAEVKMEAEMEESLRF